MQSPAQLFRKFRDRRDGIAALEFALLAPLMIYTLLAAADIANALNTTRRMTNAADTIAELVSQQTTSSGIQGTVANADLTGYFYSIFATFPDVLSDAAGKGEAWTSDIQPIVTSVTFGPAATCVTPQLGGSAPSCTTATATWSAGLSTTRSCGALNQAALDTNSPTLTTIPPGTYAPGTLIVADVIYTFTPTFTKWLTGPFTFQRTAYFTPRFFAQLTYTPTGTGTAQPPSSMGYSSGIIVSCVFTGTLP